MASVTESTLIVTPTQGTPTQKVVCPKTDCDKSYKARSSMLNHMRQKHQDVAEIPSPLGSFPPSGSAIMLQFDESDNAATQGNSCGDVNSPVVRTEATYICDLCETHIKSKEALKKHKTEAHDNLNDDVIGHDEEHLGEALDDQEATELGMVAREVERMAFLHKHAEQNCHNCAMSKEVEFDKERMLKEKDSKIEAMQRRQLKADQKKNELYKEKKKVIIENTELKKELKKCQEILAETQRKVTTLTAETTTRAGISEAEDENDRNDKIKCSQCQLLFRNKTLLEEHIKIHHMSVVVSERCNACNKEFTDNDELEIHMAEQHTDEADCARCNAFFKSEEDVMRHANNANMCNKCDREVISKAALKKHEQICKGKKQPALCRNGEACRYHKANKRNFLHPLKNQRQQPNPKMNHQPSQVTQKKQPASRPNQQQQQHRPNQEWVTVQRRSRNPLWTCNFCDMNIYNMEASRGHRVENGNCG